jgi:hypothetical protein
MRRAATWRWNPMTMMPWCSCRGFDHLERGGPPPLDFIGKLAALAWPAAYKATHKSYSFSWDVRRNAAQPNSKFRVHRDLRAVRRSGHDHRRDVEPLH